MSLKKQKGPIPKGRKRWPLKLINTRRRCAVANVSDCRYVFYCRSRVASSILARSHTFMEIDHEIISTAILLPSADLRRVVVRYKRKYLHEVLVNRLFKLAQEKKCG